jgi:hypothetical protein
MRRRVVAIAPWDSIMAEFPKLPDYYHTPALEPVYPMLTVAAYEFLRDHGPGTARMVAVGIKESLKDERDVEWIQRLLYPHLQRNEELFEEVGSMMMRKRPAVIWGAKDHGTNYRTERNGNTKVGNLSVR